MAVVYHWKHGWIPLDHEAALSKSKGNHEAAARMLSDAHHSPGIQSRQDVAKAALDLPNVPAQEHHSATSQLAHAAALHNSSDLLPARLQQVGITQAGFLGHGLNAHGTERQSHGGFTESQRVLSQRTDFATPGQPREWVPGHIEKITPRDGGLADVTIRHDDGTVQVERIGKRGGGGQIKAMPPGAERGSTADNRSVTGQQRSAELAAQAKAKRAEATAKPDTHLQRLSNGNRVRQTNDGLEVTDGERTVLILGTSVHQQAAARRFATKDLRNLFSASRKQSGGKFSGTGTLKLNPDGSYTGPKAWAIG